MKKMRKPVLCAALSTVLAFAVLFANCAPVYAAETTAPEDTCENVVSGDAMKILILNTTTNACKCMRK